MPQDPIQPKVKTIAVYFAEVNDKCIEEGRNIDASGILLVALKRMTDAHAQQFSDLNKEILELRERLEKLENPPDEQCGKCWQTNRNCKCKSSPKSDDWYNPPMPHPHR
jgi:hypothetical protein